MKLKWFFFIALAISSHYSSAAERTYLDLSLEQLADYDIYSPPVLQSHIHWAGELMVAYHYSQKRMDGMGSAESTLSTPDVFNEYSYMVTPTAMDMDMHMLHFMYAVSDQTTYMLRIHHMAMEMDHETRMGGEFTTQSEGLGDVAISMNHQVNQWAGDEGNLRPFVHASLLLPTGNIDVKDTTPMSGGSQIQLPYGMQLGSGSYQARLGLGFNKLTDKASLGALLMAKGALDKNDAGYRVAPEVKLDAWYQRGLSSNFSGGLSGILTWRGDIAGRDSRLNPNLVPTADTDNYGGQWAELGASVSYLIDGTYRVGMTASLPVWQDLNGLQLRKKSAIELMLELTL